MRRTARENAYERTLLALSARIDPIAHDPWPNHWSASGASYGVTLDAYRAIGGLPYPASGEDRALADMLLRHDIPIRHDPDIAVVTSARLDGRACGGVADTIRMRCEDPETPGDERLEPLANALRRYVWRRRLRRWHAAGTLQRQSRSQQRSWHIPWGCRPRGVGARKRERSARSGRRSRRRARGLRARLCGRATCRCIQPLRAPCWPLMGGPASRQRQRIQPIGVRALLPDPTSRSP